MPEAVRKHARANTAQNCFLSCPLPIGVTAVFVLRLAKSRRTFYAQIERLCFHTTWVESERGAVAVGRAYLLPPLSFGGASLAQPWLRFHVPLIEPDMQISSIRLSDKTSRLRVRRPLQFLNTFPSC